jgi:alpha-1,3-rhamnosyl/mannosyltransferase
MKIALNASTLLTPKAGIGLYTDKIARALMINHDYDLHLFFKGYWSKDFIKQNNKNFLFNKLINKFTSKSSRLENAIDTFYFNKYVRNRDIDLYHEPNFIAYETSIPTLITIHDLSWIHYPNFFFKEELIKFNNYFLKSLRKAVNIITHSNFTWNNIKIPASLQNDAGITDFINNIQVGKITFYIQILNKLNKKNIQSSRILP